MSVFSRSSRFLTLMAALAISPAARAQTAPSQAPVTVVDLPSAGSASTVRFGAILGVRAFQNGNVLVNDALRRQVSLCDVTLTTCKIVVDSVAASANGYPEFESPLIQYLGDSSLLVDVTSKSLLVLDAEGTIRHPMALPNDKNVADALMNGSSGFDRMGRMIYKRNQPMEIHIIRDPGSTSGRIDVKQLGEFVEVIRADLDERRIDTLGRVRINADSLVLLNGTAGKPPIIKQIVNPMPTFDEFAVMSNGVTAIVRGQDYRVDWIHADGTTTSSPKLPFDWKSLTLEDKQRLVDSATTARQKIAEEKKKAAALKASANGEPVRRTLRNSTDTYMSGTVIEIVPLKDIADYYPPIRREAAMADRDGNLWILPSTSAQSRSGELVYDVINEKEGLSRRVRLPLGRALAGFGPGGVVYLVHGSMRDGFVLERVQTPG
ncbi:MAG: hypothetical protein ACO1Q7_21095 [Gemmatimonas sp.]